MVSILKDCGFENLESLQDFCSRFPCVSNFLDEDLEKIWICHKNPKEMPVPEEINSLPSKDYYFLSKIIKSKIDKESVFNSLLTEFSAMSIFEKIYIHFNKQLATYLITKCYLFYNWGLNAFEPVIDYFEIHSKILRKNKSENTVMKCKSNTHNENYFKNINLRNQRESSVDLFESSVIKPIMKKRVSLKSVVEASKKVETCYEYSKNPRNFFQETFSLTKILYNNKQRSGWPKKHVLSKNNLNDLIMYMLRIPVARKNAVEGNLVLISYKWKLLRELLYKFIENHERINKDNGYGRILKKHLKNVKTTPNRRLNPIPKSVVCSYIFDILRRVFPVELFGRISMRKNFFRGLVRIIKGNKHENFIWYPLLRVFLMKKANLSWCSQIESNLIQYQMIFRLFKFIVIHYVFVLLKNYFYITETGTSGFGLRFYKKNDMQSVSSTFLKNLLQDGHIRRLFRSDYEVPSIERNWIETGVISLEDLRRKMQRKMSTESEYKQPIAHIRLLPKSDNSDELRVITHILNKPTKKGNKVCASQRLKKYFTERFSRRMRTLGSVKLSLEFLINKLGLGIRPRPSNPKLDAAWKRALNLKEKYGKLYFVKADISGAFDSVKHETLSKILRGAIEKESKSKRVELLKITEWKKINWKIKKTVRFSFSNRASENSVIMYRSSLLRSEKKMKKNLDLKCIQIIQQIAMEQKIEINGRIYKLVKGLAQGSAGKFSSQLCEIYYSWIDRMYFGKYLNSTDTILLRAVDDYLFISSDLEKAKQFLQFTQNGITQYNVSFNKDKLKSNLIHEIHEITYLGLIFNFKDMSVKPDYSRYLNGNIISTINLFDKFERSHFNKKTFLQSRLLRLNALKLHPIVTKGIQNNLKVMRRTIFEASLLQSLRVLTVADYIYFERIKNDTAIYEILCISCGKINSLISGGGLSKDEVYWLFFYAALNILRKYTGQFKLLWQLVCFRMQKCQKMFANDEGELLLNFLKGDILEKGYWEKVSDFFKLGKQPLRTD